jgi:acyl carrier protein
MSHELVGWHSEYMETEMMNTDVIEAWMVSKVVKALKIPADEVDCNLPFTGLGLDSLTLLEMTGDLAEFTGCDIPVSLVWEFPNITALAQRLSLLTPANFGATTSTIARDQPFPLSYAQERIWRHACHDEQGDTNSLLDQWTLRGPLDVDVLNRSLNEVIRRHEILRTTFTVEDGKPVQVIQPAESVEMLVVDLSNEAQPEESAVRLLHEEAAQAFVLDGGFLFRARLLKLSDSEYRIVFVMHHLLYDATSLEIFYAELGSNYAALRREGSLPVVKPPLQSVDFAVWQRECLKEDGAHYKKLMGWWQEYWSGALPRRLKFPSSWKAKNDQAKVQDGVLVWDVPSELLVKIQTLSSQCGATRFMLFYAAFEALLYQVTGQREMLIGSYVSDRSRPAARQAIGYYVNLVALRTRLSDSPTLLEIVEQVREKLQQVSIYQELPYEDLVLALEEKERALTRLEVIFQQIPDLDKCLSLLGVEVRRWREQAQTQMPWGLTVNIMERADGVKVRFRFNVSRYRPAKVRSLMKQYAALLEQMGAAPTERVIPMRKRWWGIY